MYSFIIIKMGVSHLLQNTNNEILPFYDYYGAANFNKFLYYMMNNVYAFSGKVCEKLRKI